ncbi:lysosomal acid phosphatase [Trichuris trichiura]|uniref:acid phosphatase n=1 Tax=Trichuris trichiura TaxID=36087 RepID=A0A077Z6N3_TRITR|nr:lysosomal acid phosphatase [Trichuris trichiura]
MLLTEVVWRHGARTPLSHSPFGEAEDDDSGITTKRLYTPEELTEVGIRDSYELGQVLRNRYYDFLNEYNPEEVYVRSTNKNRTIQTALLCLAGMFPISASDSPIGLPWQAIPVHSVPTELDSVLYVPLKCPYADGIYWNEIMKSGPVLQLMEQHKSLFSTLRKETGLALETLDSIYQVYEPLYSVVHDANGFSKLPKWFTPELFNEIESLYHTSTTFYYSDERIKPLRGAQLLQLLAVQIKDKISGKIPAAKFFGYSTHDVTIIGLLENMQLYHANMHPEFMAAIMIELYEQFGNYTVEVWYRNGMYNKTMQMLRLPNCNYPCSAEQFVKMTIGQSEDDWFARCNPTNNETSTTTLSKYLFSTSNANLRILF